MRRIVIFRHGIVINRWFMEPLARRLRRRGYDVRNRSYPTTRKFIEEHAADLAEELRSTALEAAAHAEPFTIDLVTHSMGGLVARYALTRLDAPPIRRLVQICPPNGGSATARWFRNFLPYQWIFGRKAGSQLAADLPGIYGECGIPRGVEIGIIAGVGGWKFYPVPLRKPNDGILALEETRLDGFPLTTVPYGHTLMLFRRALAERVAEFLDEGTFSNPLR
jgi:triacylglycerol lipase